MSVAVAAKVTVAPHTLLLLLTMMFAGQVIPGGVLSTLVIIKLHIVVLRDASFAVNVTKRVPIPVTEVPGAGDCVTVTAEQLSLVVARLL